MNQLVSHHHLDFPLGHLFELPRLAEKWLTAGQRPKLALPQHLPAATVICAYAASAGGGWSATSRWSGVSRK